MVVYFRIIHDENRSLSPTDKWEAVRKDLGADEIDIQIGGNRALVDDPVEIPIDSQRR